MSFKKNLDLIIKLGLSSYLLLFIFSCETVVDLDLEQGESRLVVEGGITQVLNQSSQNHQIRLTNSFNFYSIEPAPAASGAIVYVEDTQNNRYDFIENQDSLGVYENQSLQAQVGETYFLTIEYLGNTYKASEIMQAGVAIDSLYESFEEGNLFEEEGFRVNVDFQDPRGQRNFYLFETYADGENILEPDPGNSGNIILEDEFFDGVFIKGYQPNEEANYEEGQTVLVRQLAISKNAYEFYFLLFVQTARTGAFFDTPPAPIKGNIENTTNPDLFPLGYFLASEVDEKSIVIEGEQ